MNIPLDLSFDAMSEPQRAAIVAWADSHDWGARRAHWSRAANPAAADLCLAVYCLTINGKKRGTEILLASNLRQIRDWAGY